MLHLTKEQAEGFYAEHSERGFSMIWLLL